MADMTKKRQGEIVHASAPLTEENIPKEAEKLSRRTDIPAKEIEGFLNAFVNP